MFNPSGSLFRFLFKDGINNLFRNYREYRRWHEYHKICTSISLLQKELELLHARKFNFELELRNEELRIKILKGDN